MGRSSSQRLMTRVLICGAAMLSGERMTSAAGEDGSAQSDRAAISEDDWPCWRGPRGDNHALDPRPPVRWSETEGVVWKAAVPGRGHASPCVLGDKVLIASADEAASTQFLLAFDRASGDLFWRTDVHREPFPKINPKNTHASATPACDGRRVYAVFAQADRLSVTAVDLSGDIAWQKAVGKYKHANGLGASPVLHGDLVIVASDNPAEPSIVALRTSDGEVAWRTKRTPSENSATPVVGMVGGRPQLLLNGAFGVNSYDPVTGKELWKAAHKTEVAACTMAFDDERVYASGNVPEPCMLAVRADGAGDVTESHVLWKTRRSNTYVPSPLVASGRLFVLIDSGVMFCRELKSGKIVWKKRLGGNFSASPVFAGGNIYATSEEGMTHVFQAAAQYAPVAKNDLGALCLATPVICGGRAYIRTDANLYCIDGNGTP